MAGELTIEQNIDGTATINFPDGGSHTVQPSGSTTAVAALQQAYGDRIGNIVSSELTGETQISNANAAAGTNQGIPDFGASNTIPDWVDPDYGYDPANPRKPNMREFTEIIAGMSIEELYLLWMFQSG